MNKISFIIPVYNGEKYLAEAIDSVIGQSYSCDMEIIVSDDGSTDESCRIAREKKVILLEGGERRGAAFARNRGVEAATGNFLMFLDADDVLEPEALEKLITAMEKNGADMAFGNARDFVSPELTEEQRKTFSVRDNYSGILPGCALIRKEVFDRVGPFDEKLSSGETVAWLALAQDNEIRSTQIDTITLNRRLHLTNTGRVSRKTEMTNYAAILRQRLMKKK